MAEKKSKKTWWIVGAIVVIALVGLWFLKSNVATSALEKVGIGGNEEVLVEEPLNVEESEEVIEAEAAVEEAAELN